ncbi:hypothetical protein [Kineosporia succinea]|uniref:Uncharacterized protein n=1 Tax=Kineosporia succinea TaxID=84632 RepID=A0ABT9P461_9ACTN|nr:hypothetical protein [Kineosporia succinea]MDP9827479.1 hypothetical protein [Kineosporia succinea]
MSAITAHIRSSAPRHASLALRRALLGYLATLCCAPAITLGALLVSGHWDSKPPASRVVEVRCLNERLQYGIDSGRSDGLLLAKDTGRAC